MSRTSAIRNFIPVSWIDLGYNLFEALGTGQSIVARFARGTLWTIAGTVASQGFAFITSIIAARLIGPAGFGEYGIILSTVAMCSVFANPGLSLMATKIIAERRDISDGAKGGFVIFSYLSSLCAALVVSLLLVVLAPSICTQILSAPQLISSLRWSSAIVFFSAMTGLQTGILTGLEEFQRVARANIVRGIILFPLTLAGVWFWGVFGLILAAGLTSAIMFGYLEFSIEQTLGRRHFFGEPSSLVTDGVRQSWNFAFPAFLSSILVLPVYWIANTLLTRQPSGFSELGVLNATNQWRTILLFLPTIVVQVALPLLSSSSDHTRKNDFDRALLFAQNISILAVFPSCAVLMFASDWVMALYGREFVHGASTLIWSLCAIMIMSLGSSVGSALQARGRMWIGLLVNCSWACVTLGLSALLIPTWQAKAIPFATAISYLIATTWIFILLSKDLPPGTLWRVFFSLGICFGTTLLALSCTTMVRGILLLPVSVTVGVVTYRFLTDEDFRLRVNLRLLANREKAADGSSAGGVL